MLPYLTWLCCVDFGGKWHNIFPPITKASTCDHTLNANHWHCLWEIPAINGVKSNLTTFNYVCRFIVNMFHCCGIFSLDLNTLILKVRGNASQAYRFKMSKSLQWAKGLKPSLAMPILYLYIKPQLSLTQFLSALIMFMSHWSDT